MREADFLSVFDKPQRDALPMAGLQSRRDHVYRTTITQKNLIAPNERDNGSRQSTLRSSGAEEVLRATTKINTLSQGYQSSALGWNW